MTSPPPYLPDECLAIRREGQRCDGTVVALQNTDALAAPQVPDPDPTVRRGREELQSADVWMKLNQTEREASQLSDMALQPAVPVLHYSLQEGIRRSIVNKREMISKQLKFWFLQNSLYNTRRPFQVVCAVLLQNIPQLDGAVTTSYKHDNKYSLPL